MYDYFMREKVYQKFILGCENPQEALKKGLGGVIFFAKDIQSENQVKLQIKNYKKIALVPPFISIDQEGGRVERTEALYPRRLSARFAYEKGCEFLKSQSEEISRELADLGFNLNFAPCVDVNTNPKNPIIGERAFSSVPDDVIQGAKIFIESSRNNSVIPCIKHYPGHGDADSDSHRQASSRVSQKTILCIIITKKSFRKFGRIFIECARHALLLGGESPLQTWQ